MISSGCLLIFAGMAASAAADKVLKDPAWFSSNGRPVIELPVESKQAFAYGDSQAIEGGKEWRGFEVDLDHDGVKEEIVRATGRDGRLRHDVLRKFEGEWEWIGWFNGEFSLVRQAEGWLDDIVAVEGKSDTTKIDTILKFNGLRYTSTLQVEERNGKRTSSRLAPDPFVPPAPGEEFESPLVGKWASMSYFGDGPAEIVAITICEDGTYHEVRVGIVPSEESREEGRSYEAVGAELMRHESGNIDLRTGRDILPAAARSATLRSIHWQVIDGELHWDMDMGTMGGQGTAYSRVR
jgi:hypothetical protein